MTDRRRFAEGSEPADREKEISPSRLAPEAERQPPSLAAGEPVTFATFVLGLSTQALCHLGEIENPVTHAVERDLQAAKQVIDILGILREKTKNNLESSEDTLLDSMLYDLRMRYVELTRREAKEGT